MPDLWMDVDIALSEVPVNIMPLIDDTNFKSREESVVFNQAGIDLQWNFCGTDGFMSPTVVIPTSGGDYDWNNQGNGFYSIEIPASDGVSANNSVEGFGWFSGFATGILPWRGPVIGFRAAALNNVLIDGAYSATRGLAGTALPDAVADAPGGLVISDLGGLDIDSDVLTQINAALDTAIAELSQGVPSATPTLRTGMMLMYMALRNKLDVATSGTDTLEIHNDAGTRIAQKLLTDDGSDYSEAKIISGA